MKKTLSIRFNPRKFSKSSYFLLLLILVLIWAFCAFHPELFEKPKPEQAFYEVLGYPKVIDGDTVHIIPNIGGEKIKIRLSNIDAPEMSQTCFNHNDKPYNCGKESKDFLIAMVGKKTISCHIFGDDFYKRKLGECFLPDKNISINKLMVKNGMAIIYQYSVADEEMKSFEKEARENNIGIWDGSFEEPRKYRKSKKFLDSKNDTSR